MNSHPVLVVDDEPEVRELLKAVLEFSSIPSVFARDGEEALQLAREINPCVVLLDLLLPGLGGLEVAKLLKADPATSRIPVIAVTVLNKREGLDQALRAGCDDFVSKPFDLEDLHDKISRYVGGAGRPGSEARAGSR